MDELEELARFAVDLSWDGLPEPVRDLADEEGVTLAGVAAKVQRVLDLGNELVDQAPARVRATGSVAGRARQPV
jgi:hypothetical protein